MPVNYYRFVEFMKNWTETEMPPFMSVAFSSERSIEDEIERVSQAEMITVVISYVVMFVYIAVALGQFRSFKTLLVSSPYHSDMLGINPWPLPEIYAPIRHLIEHVLVE
jgi:Niemann-Pick C1 protein